MYIEIIIFAMIAAFLVYRLRSVLGRRHGEERQRPNSFEPSPAAADNVVRLPERPTAASIYQPGDQRPLAAWLDAIHDADPSFDEKTFLTGARAAFQMIVEAFAAGDRTTLRPLLSDEVYGNFVAAIAQRDKAGEVLETRIERIVDADVVDARLDDQVAYLTVKYITEQTIVTRDHSGTAIEGDPDKVTEVIDIWTYSRNTRSRDPNWQLVETRTQH